MDRILLCWAVLCCQYLKLLVSSTMMCSVMWCVLWLFWGVLCGCVWCVVPYASGSCPRRCALVWRTSQCQGQGQLPLARARYPPPRTHIRTHNKEMNERIAELLYSEPHICWSVDPCMNPITTQNHVTLHLLLCVTLSLSISAFFFFSLSFSSFTSESLKLFPLRRLRLHPLRTEHQQPCPLRLFPHDCTLASRSQQRH